MKRLPWLFLLCAASCHHSTPTYPMQAPEELSAGLHNFNNCADLLTYFQQTTFEAMLAQVQANEAWGGVCAYPDVGTATASAPAGGAAGASAPSYAGTNNQVVGVDEADMFKTFAVNGALYTAYARSYPSALILSQIYPVAQAHVVAELPLPYAPTNAFVSWPYAVVFADSSTYGVDFPVAQAQAKRQRKNVASTYEGTTTQVYVIDISTMSAPKIVRSRWMEGSFMDARMVGNTVRLATTATSQGPTLNYYPDGYWSCGPNTSIPGSAFMDLIIQNANIIAHTTLADYLPAQGDSFAGQDSNSAQAAATTVSCGTTYRPGDPAGTSVTQVTTFSLADDSNVQNSWSNVDVIAEGETLYASPTGLYIATNPYDAAYWQQLESQWVQIANGTVPWPTMPVERTTVHRFDTSVAGQTSYSGSVQIEGSLVDQFSLDETAGVLRAATTNRKWAFIEEGQASSNVFTFNVPSLAPVGSLQNIEPGEHMTAARFMQNRLYMSTMEQTDPFIIISLDGANPVVTASLPVPGDATYLQAIDSNHVLSVGYGNAGQFITGVQLAIYDVTNPQAPQQVQLTTLQGEWVYSDALYNHHALTLFNNGSANYLAFPVVDYTQSSVCSIFNCYSSGVWVYTMSNTSGFAYQGAVYVDGLANSMNWGDQLPQRSTIMGPTADGNTYVVAAGDLGLAIVDTAALTSGANATGVQVPY